MPRGRRPTAIVAIAPTLRGEITVMLLLTSLLTYNTGSGVGATSAAPTSGATSRRTALPRHEPDVIAPSRSIVEDRLIDVDRPVEPPDAVAPADVAQRGAVQVGAGDIRVRQVRADEIGADQQDLAEVRTREVRAAEIHAGGIDPHDAHRLISWIGAEVGADEARAERLGVAHRPDETGAGEVGVGEVGAVQDHEIGRASCRERV